MGPFSILHWLISQFSVPGLRSRLKVYNTYAFLFSADICLKEVPSIADSVYNIRLLKEFSNEYLNQCFYLRPEDLLYSPPVLKVKNTPIPSRCLRTRLRCHYSLFPLQQNNVMVFIAELFWWFESVKPDFVQPRDLQEIRDGRTNTQIHLDLFFCHLPNW